MIGSRVEVELTNCMGILISILFLVVQAMIHLMVVRVQIYSKVVLILTYVLMEKQLPPVYVSIRKSEIFLFNVYKIR